MIPGCLENIFGLDARIFKSELRTFGLYPDFFQSSRPAGIYRKENLKHLFVCTLDSIWIWCFKQNCSLSILQSQQPTFIPSAISSQSSQQTLHCHNVQTNCYNLTSAQNISIFKLMTNVFDVEHHFDVALILCACVSIHSAATATPIHIPPLSLHPEPKRVVCFHAQSIYYIQSYRMQSIFGGDCFHCLIFSNAFYSLNVHELMPVHIVYVHYG